MKKNAPGFGSEQLTVKFQVDDSSKESNVFTGIASVFNFPVDVFPPTVIASGAFTKTITENGSRVRVLWQHDQTDPIGVPTRLIETDKGLEVEFELDLEVENGLRAKNQINSGTLTDLSIGFDVLKFEMVDPEAIDGLIFLSPDIRAQLSKTGQPVRIIKEAKLWEFSVVTFGAQSNAKIFAVSFRDLPIASNASWDSNAAATRVESWASGSFERFNRAYLASDGKNAQFQIADIIDGKLRVVPEAIFAAAQEIQSANLPEQVDAYAKANLGSYYAKMGLIAPWDQTVPEVTYENEPVEPVVEPVVEQHEAVNSNPKSASGTPMATTEQLFDIIDTALGALLELETNGLTLGELRTNFAAMRPKEEAKEEIDEIKEDDDHVIEASKKEAEEKIRDAKTRLAGMTVEAAKIS